MSVATSFHRQLVRNPTGTLLSVTLESAGRLVLSGDPHDQRPDVYVVTPGADLTVHADEIVVSGTLRLPGANVSLFARVVSGERSPYIDCSGGPPPNPPAGLAAGVSPPGKTKKAKGDTGLDGISNAIWPYPAAGSFERQGGLGWTAAEHPEEMHGEPGAPGADGQSGGRIAIYCDHLAGELLSLSVHGGAGGKGQQGQAGAEGGNGGKGSDACADGGGWRAATDGGQGGRGGNGGRGGPGGRGGNGGSVTVLALNHSELGVTNWFRGAPGDGGDGGARGEAGSGGRGGGLFNPVLGLVRLPGSPLMNDALWDDVVNRTTKGGGPGIDGEPGEVGPNGDPGPDGSDGDGTVEIGSPNWPTRRFGGAPVSDFATLARYASLGQLRAVFDALLLDAAVLVDTPIPAAGAAEPNPWSLLRDRLAWAIGLLNVLAGGLDHATPDGALAARLSVSTFGLARALRTGRNAFGESVGFVPVATLATYQDRLQRAIANLAAIEEVAEKYRSAADNQAEAHASVELADAQADAALTYLGAELDQAGKDLAAVGARIAAADGVRRTSRRALEPLLNQVIGEVGNTFSLDPGQLLNALSQLAFTHETDRMRQGAMVVSQVGSVILDATQKVVDRNGERIDKSYVLGELRSFDNDQLAADLKANASGFKDDSSSYRYLASLDKLIHLCDQFSSNPQVQSVLRLRELLMGHIDIIRKRNRLVDEYNALVARLADLQAAIVATEAQKGKARDDLAAQVDPTASALASYVGGLADRARYEALRQLYNVQRAAVFWSLDSSTTLAAHLQADLRDRALGVSSTMIRAAAGSQLAAIGAALDAHRAVPNRFPPPHAAAPYRGDDGKDWLSAGVVLAISKDKHPDFFENLSLFGEADFELVPYGRASGAPAAVDDLGEAVRFGETTGIAEPTSGPHPFFDRPAVRLTKVRVFLDEAGAAGPRLVHLVQRGDERFVRGRGDAYPEGGSLDHRPVDITFAYRSENFRFDPARGFDAAALVGVGTEDGDLQFPADHTDVLPANSSYAPIGPLSSWKLIVDRTRNPGLDLAKVSRVLIDFHGFHGAWS